MKSPALLAVSSMLFAVSWSSLPSFDLQAALFVGAVVAVAVVVVVGVAILTPVIALQAGATVLGTCLAVGTIAVVTGGIGGVAAGFYKGRQGDGEREATRDKIRRVSNQLDIYFEPATDPKRAADFRCTLVRYDETEWDSKTPRITTRKLEIVANDSEEFYELVTEQVKAWFTQQVKGDIDGKPRRMVVYMSPYPGEGIFDRLKQIAEENGSRSCVVSKTEDAWVSAAP